MSSGVSRVNYHSGEPDLCIRERVLVCDPHRVRPDSSGVIQVKTSGVIGGVIRRVVELPLSPGQGSVLLTNTFPQEPRPGTASGLGQG